MKTTTNNHKIRVLQITGTMNMGGQETFIMNLFRNIDRDKFEFDFAIHDDKETNYYEDEIKKLGGNIIRLSPMSKNPLKHSGILKHCADLKKALKAGNYSVIHRHGNSGIIILDLIVCHWYGVPIRIAHSHSASCKNKYITLLVRPLFRIFANKKLACGKKAGLALFGRQPFEIVQNGIDLNKFKFSAKIRHQLRDKYRIDRNTTILMTIGRLEPEKNQTFLIDIFKEYHALNPDSRLVIIGDGSLRKTLEDKVKQNHLTNEVLILHNQKNIADFYNVADIFMLTSLFEGMPTVSVEAQANGLQCLFSDTITREANHSGHVEFLPLASGAKAWAEAIAGLNLSRKDYDYAIMKKYDIKNVSNQISKIYSSATKEQ